MFPYRCLNIAIIGVEKTLKFSGLSASPVDDRWSSSGCNNFVTRSPVEGTDLGGSDVSILCLINSLGCCLEYYRTNPILNGQKRPLKGLVNGKQPHSAELTRQFFTLIRVCSVSVIRHFP